MGSLIYVGKTPAEGRDISTRSNVEAQLTTGVSREYVTDRVVSLASSKATLAYVNSQDSTFAEANYHTIGDATLIPLTAKGAADGVAPLDSGGKIPSAHIPVLGAGMLRGPYGFTAAYTGVASTVPLKIADLFSGPPGLSCQLLVWMTVAVNSDSNETRPVIEVRYSTTGGTTYGSQTICAQGYGRTGWTDTQVITVLPTDPALGAGGTQQHIGVTDNLVVSAWLYDSKGASGQVSIPSGYIFSSSLYLARTAL